MCSCSKQAQVSAITHLQGINIKHQQGINHRRYSCKVMKSRKAPVAASLAAEVLKAGGEKMAEMLLKIIAMQHCIRKCFQHLDAET